MRRMQRLMEATFAKTTSRSTTRRFRGHTADEVLFDRSSHVEHVFAPRRYAGGEAIPPARVVIRYETAVLEYLIGKDWGRPLEIDEVPRPVDQRGAIGASLGELD